MKALLNFGDITHAKQISNIYVLQQFFLNILCFKVETFLITYVLLYLGITA